jgi:hypothetical protein
MNSEQAFRVRRASPCFPGNPAPRRYIADFRMQDHQFAEIGTDFCQAVSDALHGRGGLGQAINLFKLRLPVDGKGNCVFSKLGGGGRVEIGEEGEGEICLGLKALDWIGIQLGWQRGKKGGL